MSEHVTIVGAGIVGTNLAQAFAHAGHEVRFGARDVTSEKVAAAASRLGMSVVPLTEAAVGTDIVVIAVPYAAVSATATALAPPADVIVVDATNTVGGDLPADASSIVDVIANTGTDAAIVKAFNTIGAEAYLDPIVDGSPIFLPVAGDPRAADRIVELAGSIGFDAVNIGGRDAAVLNESFAALWIHLAFRTGLGRDFGFVRTHR